MIALIQSKQAIKFLPLSSSRNQKDFEIDIVAGELESDQSDYFFLNQICEAKLVVLSGHNFVSHSSGKCYISESASGLHDQKDGIDITKFINKIFVSNRSVDLILDCCYSRLLVINTIKPWMQKNLRSGSNINVVALLDDTPPDSFDCLDVYTAVNRWEQTRDIEQAVRHGFGGDEAFVLYRFDNIENWLL